MAKKRGQEPFGSPMADGADGDTVELERDGASSKATEERAGKLWFLTRSSVSCIVLFS